MMGGETGTSDSCTVTHQSRVQLKYLYKYIYSNLLIKRYSFSVWYVYQPLQRKNGGDSEGCMSNSIMHVENLKAYLDVTDDDLLSLADGQVL